MIMFPWLQVPRQWQIHADPKHIVPDWRCCDCSDKQAKLEISLQIWARACCSCSHGQRRQGLSVCPLPTDPSPPLICRLVNFMMHNPCEQSSRGSRTADSASAFMLTVSFVISALIAIGGWQVQKPYELDDCLACFTYFHVYIGQSRHEPRCHKASGHCLPTWLIMNCLCSTILMLAVFARSQLQSNMW